MRRLEKIVWQAAMVAGWCWASMRDRGGSAASPHAARPGRAAN